MSIKEVFKAITGFFNKNRIKFATIGAFALYSYDYVRATQDIDFLTRDKNKKQIINFLESLGFETVLSSDAFSNHVHRIGKARVDIMYVDNQTAAEIFRSTRKRMIFNTLNIPVVSPEHLVALKLFAIKNNPDRKLRDLADIKELLQRVNYDRKKVQQYFKKYKMYNYYNEILKSTQNENEDI
ncbi:MAG: hypothetical protein GF384_01095 [Elusimicrobia bacterium]|nr:hypothetical protein [Elusimicrobiota bacterium]MBD3411633.1 hypothetical protein [Elusimicrobiota bacterium]